MRRMAGVPFATPHLTTERLVLRAHHVADFEPYAAHMADPEASRYVGGPIDRRAAWRFLLIGAGGWTLNHAGWWSVEERESGVFVGVVGAFYRETQLDRGDAADLEVGWNLLRGSWGRGYGREAAAAALQWAVGAHDPARVIAHIEKANAPSVAVARALGMRYAGDVDFYGEVVQLHVLERR